MTLLHSLLLSLLPLLTPAVSDSIPAEVVEEEMVLKNGQIELPGTFTLPARCKDKVPAVVLVAGSGPNDRDETLGPTNPSATWLGCWQKKASPHCATTSARKSMVHARRR